MTIAPTRTDSYLPELDAKLASLSSDRAREKFCELQLGHFYRKYGELLRDAARKRPRHKVGGPSANDFLLTIGHLESRREQYRVAARKPATGTEGHASSPVNSEARS